MAIHPDLDAHMKKVVGVAGYSVTGTSATVSGSLNDQRLLELQRLASQAKYDVTVVSGVVTLVPR